YQGGYAIYKKSGGLPAVTRIDDPNSPPISTGGAGNSNYGIPGRYVPVAQGFYVISSNSGGKVVFKNSQRDFQREQGNSESIFIKGVTKKEESEKEAVSVKQRIRLGFESPDGFHRQVLVAFLEGATDGYDQMYDAWSLDELKNDAFFYVEEERFIIQAFGEFRKDREIPLYVRIDEANDGGLQKFMIDGLENISDDVEIYIKDNYNDGETYDIRNMSSFEIALEAGEYTDRFSLVFQSRLSRLDEIERIDDGVLIFMDNDNDKINIHKTAELDFKKVTLFNYIGQQIRVWDRELTERET
ncbi:hypothetical protein RM519_13935, partial [Urechidicola sp. P050]|nr:hypothetical protein [Urechidicola sp. P050]